LEAIPRAIRSASLKRSGSSFHGTAIWNSSILDVVKRNCCEGPLPQMWLRARYSKFCILWVLQRNLAPAAVSSRILVGLFPLVVKFEHQVEHVSWFVRHAWSQSLIFSKLSAARRGTCCAFSGASNASSCVTDLLAVQIARLLITHS
jgi:hypothetical protein